ncbi:uncharacterized protein BP5553_09711 [Venustampulla echinocandica]|uniref:PRISE-like Rossmann-fold domain-containing protein n=1 Tax=Venustampulla echinocandica TaxID=2656787 RepID=A0A370TBS5_9HELO|nr:uncharacterized protein BP5553_09711 [Venustampulla echinocandica]RDL31502.1 hypothetical protein BP5553_09711 [Venustampulla echinocandica]
MRYISRSLPHIPENTNGQIIHVPVDLLKGPEEISAALREAQVKADYVFFLAYLQPAPKPGASLWSNTDEINAVNSYMLSSALQSLSLTSIRPRRVVLQTGLKHYGTHLGPTPIPNMESAARLSSPPFPPNFYYKQEDLLFEFCQIHSPSTSWNVIRPSWVLGAVPDATMNILYPLAIYACDRAASHGREPGLPRRLGWVG